MTVAQLVSRKTETLQLEVLTEGVDLDRPITVPEVSSPGLVLAGYIDRFLSERLHVLGQTEVNYLKSLDSAACRTSLRGLMQEAVPCVFVTKSQTVPDELIAVAEERGVPVIRSKLSTSEFYRRITPYLTEIFARSTTMHGSLTDVYGVGLLFVGRSGIGKSECVLDLVERGHRLVADDVVHITRRGTDVLIGRAPELTHGYMEIRGAGIVDVSKLFGIRAVRQQKRIEVVVQLTDWDSAAKTDRSGLEQQFTSILDVDLPTAVVPLNPGKNITVVSEVVAMNHLLKYSGTDSAQDLNDQLISKMSGQRRLREYLSEDYE